MNPAVPTLLVNVAIVIAAVLAIWITGNPLGIFALLLLREMPVVVSYGVSDDKNAEDRRSIGFTN